MLALEVKFGVIIKNKPTRLTGELQGMPSCFLICSLANDIMFLPFEFSLLVLTVRTLTIGGKDDRQVLLLK